MQLTTLLLHARSDSDPRPIVQISALPRLLIALTLCSLFWVVPVPAATQESTVSGADAASQPLETKPKPAKNVDLKEIVEDPADLTPKTASDTEANRSILEATAPLEVTAPTIDKRNTPESSIAVDRLFDDGQDSGPANKRETAAIDSAESSKRQLVILGSEVLPGTTTRLAWAPNVSFFGISAPTSVLVVNGRHPGPKLCLTSAVHGDEINGIETVRRVLYSMNAETMAGSIIGVPIVNLQGFRAGSRYLADRRDLNRYFPGNPKGSAASRIAYSFFKEIISQCDLLIDLHTGSFRRTNLPQLRADLSYPAIQELSERMGKIVVLQSKGAKGSLRRAASELGVPAVTLEAGAPNELNKEAVESSVRSVEAALAGLGITPSKRKTRDRSDAPVYYQSTWIRASEGGILISDTALGDSVKPGDVLGAVTNPITNQRSEIVSPAKGRIIGMALNQVMHPGFAAYHLGIDPTVEKINPGEKAPAHEDLRLNDAADDEDPDDDQSISQDEVTEPALLNTTAPPGSISGSEDGAINLIIDPAADPSAEALLPEEDESGR